MDSTEFNWNRFIEELKKWERDIHAYEKSSPEDDVLFIDLVREAHKEIHEREQKFRNSKMILHYERF